MRAMVQAARRKLTGFDRSTHELYDPMKIYARMAKYYGWSHSEMEQMHFVTFFAYVREASEMIEEEKREYERARRGHGGNTEEMRGMFQESQMYEGETVAI